MYCSRQYLLYINPFLLLRQVVYRTPAPYLLLYIHWHLHSRSALYPDERELLRRKQKRRKGISPKKNAKNNNTLHNNIARTPHFLLPRGLLHNPTPPLLPPRIFSRLRPEMPTGIKMMKRIPIHKSSRILIIFHFPFLLPRTVPRTRRLAMSMPAMSIKTRRRSTERTTSFR